MAVVWSGALGGPKDGIKSSAAIVSARQLSALADNPVEQQPDTSQSRTATVIADSAATLWELSRPEMSKLTENQPSVAAELNALMLKRVAERLRTTNETVAELLRVDG